MSTMGNTMRAMAFARFCPRSAVWTASGIAIAKPVAADALACERVAFSIGPEIAMRVGRSSLELYSFGRARRAGSTSAAHHHVEEGPGADERRAAVDEQRRS